MKKVISSQKIPIKMWLEDLEDGAIQQAKNLANLPFAFKHIAIMPDSHQGFGMPIGGVLATKGVVIPNAVGVDIGCGMLAAKTSITDKGLLDLPKISNLIEALVPTGMNHHKKAQDGFSLPPDNGTLPKKGKVLEELKKALFQIGTLGGGNHFIEVQEGDDGHIWIMIHSGSRNIGYKTAKHHRTIAKEINKKYWSEVPPSWELEFLPIDSQEGQDYIAELNYATKFAECNRSLMFDRVKEAFFEAGVHFGVEDLINKPHNFAEMENHYGENVMVHRKGACRVRSGERVMIPGSQGTHSYIVKGKGEPLSFHSCSHGAGRVMGRKEAIRNLDFETEKKRLDDMGVHHNMRRKNQLDEAPSAYKDIDLVIENQMDLIEVEVKLKPLLVIKAGS